jgi:hypothetical protein
MLDKSKLTEQIVIDYHQAIADRVDAMLLDLSDLRNAETIVNLGSSLVDLPLQDVFAKLSSLQLDPLQFLKNTSIALPLPLGSYIYVNHIPGMTTKGSQVNELVRQIILANYTPGRVVEGQRVEELVRQIIVVTHEAQHAYDAIHTEDWLANYLSSFSFRTDAETRGYYAGTTMFAALHRRAPRVSEVLPGNLDMYLIRPTDKRVLKTGLSALMAPLHENGSSSSPMGLWGIGWLERRIGV